MPNLLDAVGRVARFSWCNQMYLLGNFGELLTARFGFLGALGSQAAQQVYQLACDRPAPPAPSPAFTGGQCQGVSYSVVIDWKVNWYDAVDGLDREIDTATARTVVGPVTKAGFLPFGANGLQLEFTGANGQQLVGIFGDNPRFTNQVREIQNVTVTRTDGQPDNCGDPDPEYPPYNPGDNRSPPAPISWDGSDGNQYNDNVDFTFGFPIILPNGNIEIPVNVNFNINPEFNFTGNLNLPDFSINPTFGNPGLPGNDNNPNSDDYVDDPNEDDYPSDPSGDIPDPDPNNPVVDYRRILRGVLVTTTQIGPSIGQIHQDFNPDIRIPNLGYVNFLIKVGESQGWSEDIPVKNNKQLIRCPWEGGALLVRGTPRPGVVWNLRNIYTRQTFDRRFPPEPG